MLSLRLSDWAVRYVSSSRLLLAFLLVVSSSGTEAFSSSATVRGPKREPSPWFPHRIQETVDYENSVQRLFLRHILTETKAVASDTIKFCYNTESDDPFGRAASTISACPSTRSEGGTIGWVERDFDSSIMRKSVVTEVFHRQPKAGDIMMLQDPARDQWHVIQVAELWVNASMVLGNTSGTMETMGSSRTGSFSGSNRIIVDRKKLKGLGVISSVPGTLSTYSIQTSGCQMNVADSERLAGILHNDLQMDESSVIVDSDVVIFNTCSIRDRAEQKLYNALGPFAAAKRKGKKQALIVTGCVAQQEGEALLRRVPEIDAVLGPQYVPHLRNVLDQVALGHQMVATAPALLQDDQFWNPPLRGHAVRAWVNIIHGCNEHCTYCVVPATRGIEQSRTLEAILKECRELSDAGYKEVTLLGQNIDAFGRDMVPKRTFAELLEFLNSNLSRKMRIRYVTSHPRYFNDRVIDAVANLDKVCECFHMPFQAGDDEVLRAMRRGYSYESYMKIITKIKDKAPDAAICADIIVGFPGETEEAFQKTLQLMEEVKFDNINSFAYSPRPNTEAGQWDNQIDETVKADRLQRVQKLAAEHGLERSMRYVGRIEEVLVEDPNPRNPDQVMGRTRQGRQVYFDGNLDDLRGSFVNVEITTARTWSLMGRMVC